MPISETFHKLELESNFANVRFLLTLNEFTRLRFGNIIGCIYIISKIVCINNIQYDMSIINKLIDLEIRKDVYYTIVSNNELWTYTRLTIHKN
jgi:hypothetical protein